MGLAAAKQHTYPFTSTVHHRRSGCVESRDTGWYGDFCQPTGDHIIAGNLPVREHVQLECIGQTPGRIEFQAIREHP